MSDVCSEFPVDPPIMETLKAWGFVNVDDGITWVPKSQADLLDEIHAGKKILVLSVVAWLDEKNDLEGLIGKPYPQN